MDTKVDKCWEIAMHVMHVEKMHVKIIVNLRLFLTVDVYACFLPCTQAAELLTKKQLLHLCVCVRVCAPLIRHRRLQCPLRPCPLRSLSCDSLLNPSWWRFYSCWPISWQGEDE